MLRQLKILCIIVVIPGLFHLAAQAQRPMHNLYNSNMLPGTIGRQQMMVGFRSSGHIQPVKVLAPDGCLVAAANGTGFDVPTTAPAVLGLRVGTAYRLKVSNIPLMGDTALYPSVELIDRLHPPAGEEWKYPISIEFTIEDLKLAATGNLVTRVIYLEQPKTTLVGPTAPSDSQPYFNVGPKDDPLQVADYLGRAVAIVHLGSRQPDPYGHDSEFYLNGTPVMQRTQPVASGMVRTRAAQVGYHQPVRSAFMSRIPDSDQRKQSVTRGESPRARVPSISFFNPDDIEDLLTK